ncbi:hypothetical protein GCM10023321_19120 [Pseudonocardia eucalypti]|uniref:Right handed beta helix domain-containing protein n=1 Tax=Pseudonocardia eucalypti TaxID=648755 RepID=A0ABP9PZL5_9PSEU|nr:hypothetical protein [Pseudonocardia eucalypti]
MPFWPRAALPALLTCLAALVAACGSDVPIVRPPGAAPAAPPPASASAAPPAKAKPGIIRPLARPTGCSYTATEPIGLGQALNVAVGGSKICVFGNFPTTRLVVGRSGTPQAPIQLVGDGKTTVHGISVDASYVSISGINSVNADAPGVALDGHHITLENAFIGNPRNNDGDGIRFWGSDIVIKQNTIRNTRNIRAHADCMQTFATDAEHQASQRITIDRNRCEDIDNTCLIVEGPNSEAGDGSGVGATTDIRFTNNYCQNRADQALQIDDARNVVFTGNELAGPIHHAIALQNRSTGAKVSGNKLNPAVQFEVGMDDSSRPGYQGPVPGGAP